MKEKSMYEEPFVIFIIVLMIITGIAVIFWGD